MKQGLNQAHTKAPAQEREASALAVEVPAPADACVDPGSSEPDAGRLAANPSSPARHGTQEVLPCPQPEEPDPAAAARGCAVPRSNEPSSLHNPEVKVAYGPDDLLRAMDSAPVTCSGSVRVTSLESLLWKAKT